MLPTDPLGANGPRLDKFLRFWLPIYAIMLYIPMLYVREIFGKIKNKTWQNHVIFLKLFPLFSTWSSDKFHQGNNPKNDNYVI